MIFIWWTRLISGYEVCAYSRMKDWGEQHLRQTLAFALRDNLRPQRYVSFLMTIPFFSISSNLLVLLYQHISCSLQQLLSEGPMHASASTLVDIQTEPGAETYTPQKRHITNNENPLTANRHRSETNSAERSYILLIESICKDPKPPDRESISPPRSCPTAYKKKL